MVRKWAAIPAALALVSACGPAPEDPGASASAPAWFKERAATLPDWVEIARTRDGGEVFFNPKTITRDAGAASADIWVQIRHGAPQTYVSEDTTTRSETSYTVERFQYRFRCAQGTFALVERQIMSSGEGVAERFATPPAAETDWRPIAAGGPAALVQPTACRAQ